MSRSISLLSLQNYIKELNESRHSDIIKINEVIDRYKELRFVKRAPYKSIVDYIDNTKVENIYASSRSITIKLQMFQSSMHFDKGHSAHYCAIHDFVCGELRLYYYMSEEINKKAVHIVESRNLNMHTEFDRIKYFITAAFEQEVKPDCKRILQILEDAV